MRILIVDDDAISLKVMREIVSNLMGHQVVTCSGAVEALEMWRADPFPIVVTDIRMPGMDGIELLRAIKQDPEGKHTEVVLITGFADLDTALTALRAGASEYLRKPIRASELVEVMRRLVTQHSMHRSAAPQKQIDRNNTEPQASIDPVSPSSLPSVLELTDGTRIGLFSRSLRTLAEMALRFFEDRDVPVLIDGETGTGKEMFARIVHYGTAEEKRPFITVNCAAISPTLFESELFGYVGGAFTGARPDGAPGKLEAARGGTIFFDEISEIPTALQAKLLRALQENAIYRVGSAKTIPLDVRVIAATNRDLSAMIQGGGFRQDLYYRLNVGRLSITPLRKQTRSIASLAQMFLQQFSQQKNRHFRTLHKDTVEVLQGYDWPGNIRELRNVIEYAVLLYDDTVLRPDYVTILPHGPDQTENTITLRKPVEMDLPEDGVDLEELNLAIVRRVLDHFGGNKSQTARYLGLSLSALRSRLKKLG
ncbi:response regulator [bacterium]|nr:response regulator [bacterium]